MYGLMRGVRLVVRGTSKVPFLPYLAVLSSTVGRILLRAEAEQPAGRAGPAGLPCTPGT